MFIREREKTVKLLLCHARILQTVSLKIKYNLILIISSVRQFSEIITSIHLRLENVADHKSLTWEDVPR